MSDPYKNFRFRIKFEGRYVAGVDKVSALKRITGDPRSPGRSKSEPITMESGITHDRDFVNWANAVVNDGPGPGIGVFSRDFRKDIILERYSVSGQLSQAFKIFRCWVSEFQALPELDANANAVAIQVLKLESEGWELDHVES